MPRPLNHDRAQRAHRRFVRPEPLNAASHGDDMFEIAIVPDAADRFRYLSALAFRRPSDVRFGSFAATQFVRFLPEGDIRPVLLRS